MTLGDRFWSKVDKNGPLPEARPELGPCWLWIRRIGPRGYALFWFEGKMRQAHRLAYEFVVGPVPDHLDLDHLCRRRHCVRPSHLEAVTRQENLMRGETIAAANAAKMACPQSHPYSPENTYVARRGDRQCKTCMRDRVRARRARSRA